MERKLKAAAQDSVGELPAGYPHLPTTPIKQEPELTDWISGDLKPVRDGVYERIYPTFYGGKTIKKSKFKHNCWFDIDADFGFVFESAFGKLPWRGLTKNPEVQS